MILILYIIPLHLIFRFLAFVTSRLTLSLSYNQATSTNLKLDRCFHVWLWKKAFPCKSNVLKVTRRPTMNKYNSYPFISFFAHLQSRSSQISIGIIYSTYTTSSIQHIMTTLDEKFYNGKQVYRQCFPLLTSVSVVTHHFYPSHEIVNWKFCLILHNYAKGEMTCSAAFKAYYKYMCYQWSLVIFHC